MECDPWLQTSRAQSGNIISDGEVFPRDAGRIDSRTGAKAFRETSKLAARGSGLLLFFRFRKRGGGGGAENGVAVLYEPGRGTANYGSGFGTCLSWRHIQDYGSRR